MCPVLRSVGLILDNSETPESLIGQNMGTSLTSHSPSPETASYTESEGTLHLELLPSTERPHSQGPQPLSRTSSQPECFLCLTVINLRLK